MVVFEGAIGALITAIVGFVILWILLWIVRQLPSPVTGEIKNLLILLILVLAFAFYALLLFSLV